MTGEQLPWFYDKQKGPVSEDWTFLNSCSGETRSFVGLMSPENPRFQQNMSLVTQAAPSLLPIRMSIRSAVGGETASVLSVCIHEGDSVSRNGRDGGKRVNQIVQRGGVSRSACSATADGNRPVELGSTVVDVPVTVDLHSALSRALHTDTDVQPAVHAENIMAGS